MIYIFDIAVNTFHLYNIYIILFKYMCLWRDWYLSTVSHLVAYTGPGLIFFLYMCVRACVCMLKSLRYSPVLFYCMYFMHRFFYT